jgi:hypothetical protein
VTVVLACFVFIAGFAICGRVVHLLNRTGHMLGAIDWVMLTGIAIAAMVGGVLGSVFLLIEAFGG